MLAHIFKGLRAKYWLYSYNYTYVENENQPGKKYATPRKMLNTNLNSLKTGNFQYIYGSISQKLI